MNKGQILTQIKSVIFPNDENLIDAQKHQDLEVAIVEFLYDTIFAPTDVVNFTYDLQLKSTASIISEAFTSGLLGSGVKLYNDNDSWKLEIDEITVRKVMNVFELLINKYRSVNGGLIVSPGNGKVKTVTLAGDIYTLEIEGDMTFAAGDLVRCQTFRTTGSKYYWVPITSVSGSNITVAASSFTSSLPEVGDELVQLGNTTDTSRQDAIIISASGDGAPSIKQYAGISSVSLEGKEVTVISPTENKFTGTFTIKSSGKTIETALADTQNAAESAVKSYVDINFVTATTYNSELTVLQNSIDAKASETEVSGLATRVSSAELKITSDAINLTVSSQVSSAQSSAIAAANGYADTAIANMQIGGTNLLLNSDFHEGVNGMYSNSATSIVVESTDVPTGATYALKTVCPGINAGFYYAGAGGYIPTIWENGVHYTLSFYAKSNSDVTFVYGASSINVGTVTLNSTWKKYVANFIGDGGTSNRGLIFYPQAACTFYAALLKLEYGDKATSWCLATSETVTTTVYQSGIAALQNSIDLKVSQSTFDALGTRVSTAESNISQNATDITSKVSKNGIISSINQTSESVTISASKINLSGAVTADSIAVGAVTADKIATGAITANKIAANAVTTDKLASNVLVAGNISGLGSLATMSTITASYVTDLGSLAKLNSVGLTNLDATIISNGKILTSLLVANDILTNALTSGTIVAGSATITGLTVTNATVKGNITATMGAVGPFTISTSQLSAVSDDNNLLLNASLIKFYNSENTVYIGGDVMPGTLGGVLSCPVRLECARVDNTGYDGNACMYLSATGATASDSNVISGNHVLFIPKGNICGFRLRGRRVSGQQTLSVMDSVILCEGNGDDYSLYLPTSNVEDFQPFIIRKCGSANIWIQGTIQDGWGGTQSSVKIENSQMHIFTYDATNARWEHNYMS